MSLARKMRRSEVLRKKLLVKMPTPENAAERDLRRAFLQSSLPDQLRYAAVVESVPPVKKPGFWQRLWMRFFVKKGPKS